MNKNEERAVNNLINYIDNNEYVSLEDAKIALKTLYTTEENNKATNVKVLLLKVIGLINRRTEEVEKFIDIITNKRLSNEERKIQGLKHFPFRNSNLNVEKLIIEKAYETDPYQSIEDLIIDLIYETVNNPEELKEKINEFITDTGIIIDTSKPFNPEENKKNNLGYTKTRTNE